LKSQDWNHIQRACAFNQKPQFHRALSGGDINQVSLFTADEKRWVVKKNDLYGLPQMLAKEARALAYLNIHSPLKYPSVLKQFETEKHQYLILEYVEPGNSSPDAQISLGKSLARQHCISDVHFGWYESNYIGSLIQHNEKSKDWKQFYTEQRLMPLVERAVNHQLVNTNMIGKMEAYCSRLDEIFPNEQPALLHGDLWGGNHFISKDEKPFLYDPAAYFGHREMDIAMTRLFGGFSPLFYDSYQAEYPLEKGWEKRIPHAQLYPNLVHLNLFGSAYLNAISEVLDPY
jgi:fructosamine-3-kinase